MGYTFDIEVGVPGDIKAHTQVDGSRSMGDSSADLLSNRLVGMGLWASTQQREAPGSENVRPLPEVDHPSC